MDQFLEKLRADGGSLTRRVPAMAGFAVPGVQAAAAATAELRKLKPGELPGATSATPYWPSSVRLKETVEEMADASGNIHKLRPVTYRYRESFGSKSGQLEFGLIAEEVNELFPHMVAKGPDGTIEGLYYDKLTPLLLNEIQKLQSVLSAQLQRNREMLDRLSAVEEAFFLTVNE